MVARSGMPRALAVAALVVAAERVGARPPPAGLGIAADVRLDPAALAAALEHEGPDGLAAPPGPACTVALGEQAQAAWLATARRLFAGAPGAPRLEVEISAVRGDLVLAGTGWKAVVAHEVAVRDADGPELARSTARGESPILGADAPAIPRAFARAAAGATAAFERELADAPALAAWLAARGAAPPPSMQGRLGSAQSRDGWAAFAEGAFGVPPRDDGRDVAWAARAGVSAGRSRGALVLAAGLSRWRMPFAARPPFGYGSGEGELTLHAVDLDLGAAFRPERFVEFSAGAGASLIFAHASLAYATEWGAPLDRSFTADELKTVGTVYAAAHFFIPLTEGLRLRAGVEARARSGPTFEYEALWAEPVRVRDAWLRLLVGLERPLARAVRP